MSSQVTPSATKQLPRHMHTTVVIDVGSGCMKAGLAGEDNPRCILSSVIAAPDKELSDGASTDLIDRGNVQNWDGVESLLTTIYSQLHVQPESGHALLLTRDIHGSAADAERFVQMAMEKFGASAVHLAVQPVLSLYSAGLSSGVVVDCGQGLTQVVPVFEGYVMEQGVQCQRLAGRDVTLNLQSALANRKPDGVQVDFDTARQMKENLCYVSASRDLEAERTSDDLKRSWTLPGGDVITVGEERFRCAEILFQPSLVGSEYLGLPKLVHKSVSACPIDVRNELYDKVIMAGGTTRMSGICQRLLNDISNLTPRSKVKIVADKGRELSAWRGGCVLAGLPSFPSMCVSKDELAEYGASIVGKKFL